ncbi:MAG: cupredoxin domain-containing protein [Nitrospirae bacterium]|nr:cupredoxin domain-containing protein [Nitrospirota bacterium]MDE3049670.1 hypothetical protein [Nitrospirota bacterium]
MMKARRVWTKLQLMCVAMGAIGVCTVGMADFVLMPAMAELAIPEMTIHVTMKNRAYHVTGHTSPGALTAIVLRNEDTVTHGFSSPLFRQTLVITEGDAEEIRRRGHIFSYHVDPGKTATIYFKKSSPSHHEAVQVAFWCDIHAQMQGEFLVVETTSEI